jgi:hypothetical protein
MVSTWVPSDGNGEAMVLIRVRSFAKPATQIWILARLTPSISTMDGLLGQESGAAYVTFMERMYIKVTAVVGVRSNFKAVSLTTDTGWRTAKNPIAVTC